jgi:membrane protein implicated in regulation of membrane protease activity
LGAVPSGEREENVVSALGFLLAWANAPFAIAAGIAALFALLQVTGVLGLIAGGEGDADHDVDHDVDADHDADGDHDGDHEGDDRTWAAAALAPLGFGKIPFSMIWQTFALFFAATGFGLNLHFMSAGGPPLHSLAWTLPTALFAGYLGVAVVARVLGPLLSSTEQEATSRAQLIGQTGVVISTRVDSEFGEVRIRDKSGHDLRVVCKLAPGAKSVPREHESVLVVDYSDEKEELFVERLDLAEEAFGEEKVDDETEETPADKSAGRLM